MRGGWAVTETEFRELVNAAIRGDIGDEDHRRLQAILKRDARARALFREIMDLEAALRTWAAEGGQTGKDSTGPGPKNEAAGTHARFPLRPMVLTAATMVLFVSLLWVFLRGGGGGEVNTPKVPPLAGLGRMVEQPGTEWLSSPAKLEGGRFTTGVLDLAKGVAELRFATGTRMVLEGPCRLDVETGDKADLDVGQVVVHIVAPADRFTLRTQEAILLNQGTEYAVAVAAETTEIHVFEGAVLWQPTAQEAGQSPERIEAGQARRYQRTRPGRGARIPLASRRFVRRLEEDLQRRHGGDLLAYDGFENLAGRLHRGRSGFGWENGWRSGPGSRGAGAIVVEAPVDRVFGHDRAGRRLLRLSAGKSIRRALADTHDFRSGKGLFISILLRTPVKGKGSFYLALGDGEGRRRWRRQRDPAFGIDSEGRPFVRCGEERKVATRSLPSGDTVLCVAHLASLADNRVVSSLKVYSDSNAPISQDTADWAVSVSGITPVMSLARITLSVDGDTTFDLDELKVGRTRFAVTHP